MHFCARRGACVRPALGRDVGGWVTFYAARSNVAPTRIICGSSLLVGQQAVVQGLLADTIIGQVVGDHIW